MNNISFIVKINQETQNLQEVLDKLKEIVIGGDEVVMYIEPSFIDEENLNIINQCEFNKKSKSKSREKIIIHVTKIFNSIDLDIESRCVNYITHYVDLNIDKSQINLLR